MSKRETIARYHIIIKKLRKRPATFAEIADCLALESEIQDYDFNVSKRTFQRDLEDILTIYNLDIRYDFSRKVYYIDSEAQPDVNERMFEAFDTFNALNLSDRLSHHIHFEKRKAQGTENLYGLLHAIRNKLQIQFHYYKFEDDEVSERYAAPLALKEFKNRWYLLAEDLKSDQIKTFALDRLGELEILKKHFEFPKDFDVREYFKFSFGIINPQDQKSEEIILSFDAFQGKYIKSLPLHESQEVLVDNEEELQIRLRLLITHDFVMELLSFGASLKVLQPNSLVKQIKATAQNVLKLYE